MNLESFLRYLRYEKNYSSCTVLSYKNDLQQFMDFRGATRTDAETMPVEPDDIRSWVVELSEQGISPRTIGRKISALRSYYKYALSRGLVAQSPLVNIKLPKAKKTLPSFVRPDAMDLLLESSNADAGFIAMRDALIVEMLYETGMRRAELVGLRDAAVDNRFCEIRVHGKRNKERIVPYGEKLRCRIEQYRDCRDKQVGSCEMFFVREDGEPIYAQLVYRVVRAALCRVSTLRKNSPHVLRHSFASALLNDGAGINSVKELLGHSSLASTEVYTHITFEELKQNYKQAHPRAVKKGGFYER